MPSSLLNKPEAFNLCLMKNQMTIIKIGGSVITYKNKIGTIKRKRLEQIADELKSYLEKTNEKLIVIHGAGSFGHPLAKKYNISDPRSIKSTLGVGLTHASMHRLSLMLCDAFLKRGLPVYPISSGSVLMQKGGRISFFKVDLIHNLLKKDIIPVLHGDVVIDEDTQFSICSGDQIVTYISNKLPTRRVFFLTDVEGVFTEDPKSNQNATLIRSLKKREMSKLRFSTKNTQIDVTGLMEGKLREVAKVKVPVLIFNGNKEGNLLRALRGDFPGTLIR